MRVKTGNDLATWRKSKLWTQAHAAVKLGYNGPQYVSQLEARENAELPPNVQRNVKAIEERENQQ